MIYEDFILQIVPVSDGGYVVYARSSRGEGKGPFVPPAAEPWQPCVGLRDLSSKEAGLPESPEEFGEQLFEALFPDEIIRLYERCLEHLDGRSDVGLRIKLMLDPRDSNLVQLQALPWELLRQPSTPEFLALSRLRPIVRYLTIPRSIHAYPKPERLRILPVAASPRGAGLQLLDLGRELANLKKALAQADNIELVDPPASTLEGVRQALLERECHVLHFMGHGGFNQDGVLHFEAADGSPDPVRGTDLVNTLAGFPAPRLVFLNACRSAQVVGNRGFLPFAGVAGTLVMGGLPAVVAMQIPISDKAAIAFSRAFYQRLVAGESVDTAVAEGRQAIHSQDRRGFEWATPVLFLRSPQGELFSEKDIPPEPLQRIGIAQWLAAAVMVLLVAGGAWLGGLWWLVADGMALLQNGRLTAARERLLTAETLAPWSGEIQSNLAGIEQSRGRTDLAERHYRKAVRLEPDNPEHLFNLGFFLNRRQHFKDAYPYLQEAVDKGFGRTDAHGELALAALRIGLVEKARESLVQALRIDGERASLYRLLGEVALREGKPDEAARYLRAAMDRYPTGDLGRLETTCMLAEAYDALGDAAATCRAIETFLFQDSAKISEWAPAAERIARRRNCHWDA